MTDGNEERGEARATAAHPARDGSEHEHADAALSTRATDAPPAARAVRTTLHGTAMPPAARSAVIATPRTPSDSRPPPLTARAAAESRARRASTEVRAATDAASEARFAEVPASEARDADVAASEARSADVAADETRATDTSVPGGGTIPATTAIAAASALPSAAPTRAAATLPAASTLPAAAGFVNARPQRRAPTHPDRSAPPLSVGTRMPTVGGRAPTATTEPRDVAVVANPDDAKRVQRIAKRARLEVSTFERLADVPDYCALVTVGEAWSAANDARIAYVARSTITDDQLADLLTAMTTGRALAPAAPLAPPHTPAEARRSQIAFAAARELAASTDLATAEDVATAALRDLLDIDRAYLLLADPDTGRLWSERRRRAAGDERRAIAGIAGWCARTGRSANVARASADPRYLGPLDDPDGDPNSQLLVHPLVRSDDRVHGILIAVRRPRRPGFTDTDVSLLARFAALAAAQLEQLAASLESQALVGDDAASSRAEPLSAPAAATWLLVVRGQHPLARWVFLAIGAVIGALLATRV